MDRAESIAKRVIEAVIPGTRMIYRADQSSSVPDFDLEYPNGERVPLEVTMSTTQRFMETMAAIDKESKGGGFLQGTRVRNGWLVIPLERANINRIRARIDSLLADLEALNIDRFDAHFADEENDAAIRGMRDLGIDHASTFKWRVPRLIRLSYPGQGTTVDPHNLQRAIEEEAHKKDNRDKLARILAKERHLLVYVDFHSYDAWTVMVGASPPSAAPQLPPEITCVWAVAKQCGVEEYVVWRAAHGASWEDMGTVPLE